MKRRYRSNGDITGIALDGPSLRANRRRRKKGRVWLRRVVRREDDVLVDEVVEMRPGDSITMQMNINRYDDRTDDEDNPYRWDPPEEVEYTLLKDGS